MHICSPHGWAIHHDPKDNVTDDVGEVSKGQDIRIEGHQKQARVQWSVDSEVEVLVMQTKS